ncbi:MAG TPA: hypothetical protein VNX65_02970 [Patescibacteria group bacterium]|jgi:hypothetical protein|nr:hypothetical protein [Patescibacteria group bacterium]
MRNKILKMTTGAMLVATVSTGVAFAAPIQSDYARDLADGQAEAQAHSDIAAYEQEVKDSENVQSQVDNGQVQIDQTVGPQESQMDDGTSGSGGMDNSVPAASQNNGGANQ